MSGIETSPQRPVPDMVVQAAVAAVGVAIVAGAAPWILNLGMGGLEGKLSVSVLLIIWGVFVVGVAAVMGLPLRLSDTARSWWVARPAIPVIGGALALVAMLAVSILFQPTALDLLRTTSPGAVGLYLLLGLSWLGLEFFALHWWVPVTWYRRYRAKPNPS